METFSHRYFADLIAFSEAQDLPPCMHIFAEIKANKEKLKLERNTRVVIIKVRETTDCYSAILLNGKNPTAWEIERELSEDLMNLPIRLSNSARQKIGKLFEKEKQNNLAFYIDNEVLNERHRYCEG